jgi:Flp pilus assembly protein TadG
MRISPHRRSADRPSSAGQSLVELALVLPLMAVLFMGTVDIGRLLFTYIALEEAVQEGATYAAQVPTPAGTLQSRVEARVHNSSSQEEVTGATVAMPVCTTSPAPGTVTVTSSTPVTLLTPIGAVLFGGTVTLTATVVATNLQESC